MERRNELYEISFSEFLSIFIKNYRIIAFCVVIGVTMSVLWSSYLEIRSSEVLKYTYTASVLIEGEELENGKIFFVRSVLTHPDVLWQVKNISSLSNSDFEVRIVSNENSEIIDVEVSGYNAVDTKKITNELINQVKNLFDQAFEEISITVVNLASISTSLESVSGRVRWIVNSLFGSVMGGLVATVYILFQRFANPLSVGDSDFERMFDSKIIGKLVNKKSKRKLFEVI